MHASMKYKRSIFGRDFTIGPYQIMRHCATIVKQKTINSAANKKDWLKHKLKRKDWTKISPPLLLLKIFSFIFHAINLYLHITLLISHDKTDIDSKTKTTTND